MSLNVYEIDTWADFINIYAPMQCFQNALAYYISAVTYKCKMLMKWTPRAP